ncbi:16S rRNA (guanine(966)-N(2))-methyltransferase [Pseudoalteromonas luteoviolacea B = ATCC 29581]|nr:16S rRNA (guanine(966)-N(2))-methyltransferase [Pseudoalteromonas luteoviolacea B = ATCC 29581]
MKDVEGLRPTTDRVKETLFNWLMNDVRGTNVLDCFAGSGGLGFEALSRFAESVTFIEKDKSAASQIKANIATLKSDNALVIEDDALTALNKSAERQFDLVFIDPPFRKGLAEPICQILETQKWLTDNALVYVEVETEILFTAPDNWTLLKDKEAGQVAYRLYSRR